MTRRAWVLAGGATIVAVAVASVVVRPGGGPSLAKAGAAPVSTETVERGTLSAAVSQDGILTYRGRADGSPFSVINRARGTYTALPEIGTKVGCGSALYRVDNRPVLLLCGDVPAYRALRRGDTGPDVRQLNRNLDVRGAGSAFTTKTESALGALERREGLRVSGSLGPAEAVFLPQAIRIAKVGGELGGPAQAGAQVLRATTGTLHVEVNLDPSVQGQVGRGDRARITLPGNRLVAGRVNGFGRVAVTPDGQDSTAADATIPAYVSLDNPSEARGLDRAPVSVDIATKGVANALSVPVTALVGKAGGGFAVEVARSGQPPQLVPVRIGLFDSAGGRVQVDGDVHVGDRVVVPSS